MESHTLKIEKKYFNEILRRVKSFEIRRNDRNFKAGDFLTLQEINDGKYTGSTIECRIGFVCDYAQKENYVVFSILDQMYVIRPSLKKRNN